MAIDYWAGDCRVRQDELESIIIRGDLDDLIAKGLDSILVDDGTVTAASLEKAIIDFDPVGLGKPLSIRIRTIYVGKLPKGGFGSRPDVLVTSGVKAVQTFGAVGRAINLITRRVLDRSYLEFSALESGTALVYYTKSVTDYDVLASFELVPDTFDAKTVSALANLFTQAGGLPVFAPASTYLLAAGVLTRIFKDLGNALLEKGPVLRDTMLLNFGAGGLPAFKEGYYIVTNDATRDEFKGHEVVVDGDQVRLRDKDGKDYGGDVPYMLIAVDGKSEVQLEAFEGHLASAAVLEKYYPSSDAATVIIRELGESLMLYNDLVFRRRAEDLAERMKKIGNPDDPEYLRLKALYDAYQKSISQKEFQVPDLR